MPGYRKLGRPTAHRKAMLRNLVTDLLREGRISTTEHRAKEARRQAEKMITLAKRGDLHARRQVLAYVYFFRKRKWLSPECEFSACGLCSIAYLC